jgi:hypothetical protein
MSRAARFPAASISIRMVTMARNVLWANRRIDAQRAPHEGERATATRMQWMAMKRTTDMEMKELELDAAAESVFPLLVWLFMVYFFFARLIERRPVEVE